MTTLTTAHPRTENAERRDLLADAQALSAWLLTDTAARYHPEARVMGTYLRILLTSPSPDAVELLADEIASIRAIVCGGEEY